MAFANGPKALAICDSCGFQYLRKEMSFNTTDTGMKTKILVCHDCNDPPHPQGDARNFKKPPEAINIKDPRPDPAQAASRSLSGFDPVIGVTVNTWPRYDQ